HPTTYDVRREYDRIWSLLGDRQIEELLDSPLTADPDILAILDVLTELVVPAVFFDQELCALVTCRMLNLCLEHGNSDAACFAFVWGGITVGGRFGNYKDGFRFGQLGYDLVEKRGLTRYQARTYMSFGSVLLPRTRHALEARRFVRRAFDVAYRMGDVTFAAYSLSELLWNFLIVGDPLADVQTEAEDGLEFVKRARFGLVVDLISAQLQLVRTLRGLTDRFGSFNDGEFNETEFERHLASDPGRVDPEFGYWALKAVA